MGRNALLDLLQGASNAAADSVAVPVDMIAAGLRRVGVPVPQNALGGTQWQEEKGLRRKPQNALLGMAGETAGMLSPVVAAAKAPQIAAGMLQAGRNLAAQSTQGAMGQRGAILWHSSPYKFDEFAPGKIGSGEGNASFGVGTYLAESPDVSGMGGKYFEQFKRHPAVNETGGPYAYAVDLPDGVIGKMLDWDKPLKQQPPEVRMAITKIAQADEEIMSAIKSNGFGEMRGDVLYAILQDAHTKAGKRAAVLSGADASKFTHEDVTRFARGGNEAATERLRAAGVPGVKYLDGASRGTGSGTNNFVVFPGNESLLKVLERNGQRLR